MKSYTLGERAVLMRFSAGLPGEQRKDPSLTSTVTSEHKLGAQAGKWLKTLYPPEALSAVKEIDNRARQYHDSVTLPFDIGIGILPAKLIKEYGDTMRQFKGERENVVESQFLKDPKRWVDWAITNHNGTFDCKLYPGCTPINRQNPAAVDVEAVLTGSEYVLDVEEFRTKMRKKFSFRSEPLPVPDSGQFCETVASLLGTDLESVDVRIRDAQKEAEAELIRRLIAPVKAMADKLAEQPKLKKDGSQAADIVFRDTLVTNIQDIAKVAGALNLSGDPAIDAFITEMQGLTNYAPDVLRKDKATRTEAQQKAADILKRLEGYSL